MKGSSNLKKKMDKAAALMDVDRVCLEMTFPQYYAHLKTNNSRTKKRKRKMMSEEEI